VHNAAGPGKMQVAARGRADQLVVRRRSATDFGSRR
jgi:hypothetical protein